MKDSTKGFWIILFVVVLAGMALLLPNLNTSMPPPDRVGAPVTGDDRLEQSEPAIAPEEIVEAEPPAAGEPPAESIGPEDQAPEAMPRDPADILLEGMPPPVTAPAPVSRPRAASRAPGEGAAIGTDGGTDGGVVGGALPTAPPPFQIVPVFYGTDRGVTPDPDRLKFGTERAHVLQLGKALVTVPAIHRAPKIERPWLIEIPYFKVKLYEEKEDPAKHFTIQEITAMTREQLLADVRAVLGQSNTFKNHAFVFVHGFNTSFDNAIYRTAQISYDMKFDGAAFVYSWPSGGNVASYTYDRGSAEQAEPHLANFLDMVIKESGATSISLIAHSMGNELLLRVLERMRPEVPEGVEISQVIFAAPDVDRDKFRNLAGAVSAFAKGVTLYAAANDRALGYSARFWGGVPRAGDVPAAGPIIVPGIDTIDVTTVSTDSLGLNHSGYAENKALIEDIRQLLLTGVRPPDMRVPSIPRIDSEAGAYWKFAVTP